ncbi:MAG: DMT family transporter [Gemmobacter sp.]
MPLADNTRGAVLMMAAMAGFTVNDAFMKSLSGEVPLFQGIFLRGALATLCLGLAAAASGALRARIDRGDMLRVGVRGVAEILAAWFFILALFNLPLANVTAVLQALPLTVTLAAALFMGEPVGWRRFTAIGVGFCGVILIVRPGPEGFNLYAFAALAAVACVTVRDLVTRRLTPAMPSLLVAAAVSGMVTVFAGLASLTETWAPLGAGTVLRIAGAGAFVILGYIASVGAMRVGEIGAVAPFRYTSLLWALILGLAVFGEWPDPLTLAGAGIVAATGLYTLYREQRLRRRARP